MRRHGRSFSRLRLSLARDEKPEPWRKNGVSFVNLYRPAFRRVARDLERRLTALEQKIGIKRFARAREIACVLSDFTMASEFKNHE